MGFKNRHTSRKNEILVKNRNPSGTKIGFCWSKKNFPFQFGLGKQKY